MYKTILVPHAGTPAGDKALKHAIFAANDTSRIIILHVIEAIQYPPSFALSSSERKSLMKSIDDANEEMRKDMELKMEKLTQQCNEKDIKSVIKVEIGDAAEIILDAVEKEKVDLIVMSKRRKLKGMKKLLSLGSVSRKVVENVTCPVTLIDIENI
ncbi:MAG: universal stress protein [Nitrosopumilus sp.]|nr:universal stress protein [Nitrosopumilus sp.]